jgi:hypothetical protein
MMEFLSALLTPIIALITTYIAIQQWRLERHRWRLDLYDKRFETYRAVVEFISLMCTAGDCSNEERIKFLQTASRNYFLFEPDIQDYITEMYKQSLEKGNFERAILNSPGETQDGYRGMLANKAMEVHKWFASQFDEARERFGAYLELHKR